MDLSFENKVALVTGASSGIGLATAKAFAEATAKPLQASGKATPKSWAGAKGRTCRDSGALLFLIGYARAEETLCKMSPYASLCARSTRSSLA